MKLLITPLLIVLFALSCFTQTTVQGRAQFRNGTGASRVYVAAYNMGGMPVASSYTNFASTYHFTIPGPCCGDYIIAATSWTILFSPPAYFIQTQFDNGEGFIVNFYSTR